MSRIRVIKPKKIIPKPKPMKLGSKLNHANTQIKDLKNFEDILKKLFDKKSATGIISSISGESTTVNYKISENVGFKKNKNGILEIITTDRVSSHEKLLIKKIASQYNLFKAKKVLVQKGYKIKEEKIGNKEVIVGTIIEVDECEQSIEVSNLEPTKSIMEVEKDDFNVEIHSKNFEDSEKCKETVELINNEIEGEIIDDYDTAEYLPIHTKKKENKLVNKIVKSGTIKKRGNLE